MKFMNWSFFYFAGVTPPTGEDTKEDDNDGSDHEHLQFIISVKQAI